MSGVIPEVPPIEHIHRIISSHATWKYEIELTVGPADSRWHFIARGEDLEECKRDIEAQKAMMQK